eukprot:5262531-Pyramimonas_sp.AAC.1
MLVAPGPPMETCRGGRANAFAASASPRPWLCQGRWAGSESLLPLSYPPFSYTHLTLPTILLV